MASQLIKAKRPVEYDQRLKLVTDISEESYGMPSLESYMSVVVFGHLVFLFRSVLFIVPSLLMIVLIGVSRLYSRSRFPHQIVISYILGALGLTIGMQMCHAIRYEKLVVFFFFLITYAFNIDCRIHINIHLGTIGPVLYAIMAIFALSIESNQSRLLGISKKEFIRVLSDIINSSSSNSTIDGSDDGVAGKEDEGQQHNLSERSNTTPRAAAFRRAVERASLHNKKGSYIKRDSLYFLQKSLEQRESSRSSRSSASYMSSRDFSDGEFYEGSVL